MCGGVAARLPAGAAAALVGDLRGGGQQRQPAAGAGGLRRGHRPERGGGAAEPGADQGLREGGGEADHLPPAQPPLGAGLRGHAELRLQGGLPPPAAGERRDAGGHAGHHAALRAPAPDRPQAPPRCARAAPQLRLVRHPQGRAPRLPGMPGPAAQEAVLRRRHALHRLRSCAHA
eukprot:scaffold7539_cov390-Prasinococcus_capsulatus_cf.AAC.3